MCLIESVQHWANTHTHTDGQTHTHKHALEFRPRVIKQQDIIITVTVLLYLGGERGNRKSEAR